MRQLMHKDIVGAKAVIKCSTERFRRWEDYIKMDLTQVRHENHNHR
jgi:hypothetical protein